MKGLKQFKRLTSQFRVSKSGKISDKTMTLNLVSCVVGILLCVSSLTAATWAWFQANVSSTDNVIQAADYTIEVTVSAGNTVASEQTGESAQAVSLARAVEGGYAFTAEEDGTYTVQLTYSGSASTGYCKLVIGATSYYTEQLPIPVENGTPLTVMRFALTLSRDTTVQFIPCWGTYKEPARDILNGMTYTVGSDGVLNEPS